MKVLLGCPSEVSYFTIELSFTFKPVGFEQQDTSVYIDGCGFYKFRFMMYIVLLKVT